jgi:formate dehydrogenase major subunit
MGEDLAHIHPNQNKITKALKNLEMIVTQELFMNEIAKKSDIVFGVKSAYEKSGVYVNAMRLLSLSTPIIENNLPDDWEVLRDIENKIKGEFLYNSSEDVWNEARKEIKRYSGASYIKLSKNRHKGMQWPIDRSGGTTILHKDRFATHNGKGKLCYHQYQLRGQIKDILDNKIYFYLTTGRTLVQYNNSAQTKRSVKLNTKYPKDILQVSYEDREFFQNFTKVKLKSPYGETDLLDIKIVKGLKKGTLFTTFHHFNSHINYLFGDEADQEVLTPSFKSIKVEVILSTNKGVEK